MNFEKTTRANAYNRTTTQVAAPVAIEPVPKADAASVPSIPAPTSIGCFNQGANPLSRQSSVMRKEESKQPQLSSSSSQVSPTKRGFESKAESSFAAKKDDSKRRRLSGKDIRPPVPAASKASPSSQPDRHSLPGQSFSAESGSQPIPSPPSSSSSSAPTKPLTYHVGPCPMTTNFKVRSPHSSRLGGRNEWRSPYDTQISPIGMQKLLLQERQLRKHLVPHLLALKISL
ncbi:hypothetical protein BDZ97DRAFT_717316 [Flammula alnicola]|nr:hypothetical protein BDZ97DRAFT_717316 [Flammula alnicola]